MSTASLLLAVDPVPWARAQMAFTLAVHIVLVPLGVSWACMALIAHARGLRRGDADALRLARHWSKCMAVTFAVGAVTGTVLTFEFGLLWPHFMDRFGPAFGIPFAIEGLFFFTEAIFIAIYIYGWKRLSPWVHWWTGVPVVLAGIGGTVSVVAANAWMNEPAGFTLDAAGRVASVDPLALIFNAAMPLQTAHMLLAAYVVGGFLVASVYAAALLRGQRERYQRLGFLIPFSVAALAMPAQMLVGDLLARRLHTHEPVKFAAIELVHTTSSDVPEFLLGRLQEDGSVQGGLAIPGLASWLADHRTGRATVIQGLSDFPADERPTTAEVNVVHWAWDVMVALGSALFALSLWFGASWLRRRDLPRSAWFLRGAAAAGVAAVVSMEAGWVVTEVGRQPWILVGHMKVAQAATGDETVRLTFLVVVGLYLALACTLVWILRVMARRFREGDERVDDAPYGPQSAHGPARGGRP